MFSLLVSNERLTQALLLVSVLTVGGIIGWLLNRHEKGQNRSEVHQKKSDAIDADIEARVSVVEGKVYILEGGQRFRFDLKLDQVAIEKAVKKEVAKQVEAAEGGQG
jgi:hypothetical protein